MIWLCIILLSIVFAIYLSVADLCFSFNKLELMKDFSMYFIAMFLLLSAIVYVFTL